MKSYIRLIYAFIFFSLLNIIGLAFAQSPTDEMQKTPKIVVFQSDYGLKEGGASIMHGIALQQSVDLQIHDLTHQIPPFDIWEASYRLKQTIPFWPQGTVFVSAVDPKLGADIDAVAVKTKTGHYVIATDNGTLTLIQDKLGIQEIRLIKESDTRKKQNPHSSTFYTRDAYAYIGARFAAGLISFEDIGPIYSKEIDYIPYQKASIDGNIFHGNIPVLAPQFGNIWTNIPYDFFAEAGVQHGDGFEVTITHQNKEIYKNIIPFDHTFNSVAAGRALIYINELNRLALAVNLGDFSKTYNVSSGPDWSISIKKLN